MFDLSWQKIVLWGSFIFFLGALLLRQESAINQDLGRHLRLGEMMVSGGEARKCALFTNCLTYTYPDYPFVNHHWGSEVIFYLIYKIGGFSALIIFKTVILGLAFIITVQHAIASKGSTFGAQRLNLSKLAFAITLTFLSINMMADRLTTRPEIFGYLLFSLLFWILDKSYIDEKRSLLIYITPAIILLWVNLHISFVFGVILIWLWAITKILSYRFSVVSYQFQVDRLSVSQSETDKLRTDKLKTENRKPKTDNGLTLIVALVSTIVTALNPAGFRGALMPFSIMKDYGYTIVENMTPFFLRAFKPQPEYWIYAIFLVITTIMVITSNKKPSAFSVLTFYLFSIFPLTAVRHLAFFALVMVPVLLKGLSLGEAKDSPFQKIPVAMAIGLFLEAMINPIPLAYAKLPAVSLAADPRHDEAIKFVKQNHFQGRMWNNYDIGSYLEWALPEHPTFVDGRPEAFPAGFFQKTYIPMQESRQKWDEVVIKYDIKWVFAALTDATPWFGKWRRMIDNHEEWRIVYIDKSTMILVRLKQTD